MQKIPVGRWFFWAGVLVLVASIVVSALYGALLSPPFGTEYNVLPGFVIVAIVLLLISVTIDTTPAPAAGGDSAESRTGDQ